MNKLNLACTIFFICFFLVSCFKSKNELTFDKEEYENGYLYHIKKDDSLLLDIGFYNSGELSYLSNFPNNYEQAIFFHKRTGVIQSKLKIDTVNKIFGQSYYFYEKSGNLSSEYNYVNNIKTGSAVSYHDSSNHIKEVMLYDSIGQLYYRKTFDKQGNHVKTEGTKYKDNDDDR